MTSYEDLGGDATGTVIGDALFADYAEAGQAPNPGMGVWFMRTVYDAVAGMPVDQAIAKPIANTSTYHFRSVQRPSGWELLKSPCVN